jgi:trimethylamine--corrinoid protein Co-methyltransferase
MRGTLILHLGPRFSLLSKDQCAEIHRASLKILETTGTAVQEPEALELLRAAGADVKDGRFRAPCFLVESAIRSAPSRITIYNREGRPAMCLEGSRFYFGSLSDQPDFLDPISGQRRRHTSQDVATMTRLVDALPHIDFTIVGSEAVDYPPEVVARVCFSQAVMNTTKPLGFLCPDVEDLVHILEMAEVVVGGREELTARPFVIHYAEPISPLKHYGPSVRKLLLCAERRIPVIYAGMPQAGATAPATFAGTLAQAVAESLAGLVIHQLKRPGAPFVFGAIPTHFEMKTTVLPYGAPELHLLCAAMAEMAHYYDLPNFGTGGTTDAKQIDAQAATEAALSLFMASISGAQLIHDVGQMDGANLVSPEFLVYNNEVIAMIKNYFRTVDVDAESLALHVINRVGPDGNFLQEEHTLRHFREDWYSDLFDRRRLDAWLSAGGESFGERLRQRTCQILVTHRPKPLPEEVLENLEALRSKWLSLKDVR